MTRMWRVIMCTAFFRSAVLVAPRLVMVGRTNSRSSYLRGCGMSPARRTTGSAEDSAAQSKPVTPTDRSRLNSAAALTRWAFADTVKGAAAARQ